MEQPIPQGCGVNEALQDRTFAPYFILFRLLSPHAILFHGFLEGVPEFTQVLFSHCTKEETEAWGSGFLGSSVFMEKSKDWNSCPLTQIPELFPQHCK